VSTPPLSAPARDEFASTDVAEVREFLDKVYGWRVGVQRLGTPGHPLTVSSTDAGLVASAHGHAPGDLSYRVTGADYVVVDTLYRGTVELEPGHGIERYVGGDVFLANHPGANFVSRTHDVDVLATTFPSALLTEAAGLDPDHPVDPVEFRCYTPSRRAARRWRAVSWFVDDLLNNSEAAAAPLVIGSAARLLAATALATFPTTLLDGGDTTERADATPDTLRRATAFIDSNAGTDIGLADIAAAAYATPRAVQYAFRRHRGTSPMAYLRRVRLAAAHHDLQAADPSYETITSIAAAWGFPHPGRFAAQYRAVYGQTPSTTLQS
jgi:AraC-like DNA-binding protein